MADLPVTTWIRFVAWLVVGVVIYALYGFRRSRVGEQLEKGRRALEWSETGEDASEKIRRGLELADEGEGAVILTDMFGGTPTNLTLPFLRKDRIEIVTGVNLPMVLKCAALQKSGRPVTEVAHVAKDRGQRSIYVASDLLAEEAAPPAETAALSEKPGR